MNATQLADVLQKIKTDPVLQETLRITKQDWVELNLTTQESLQASMNIASAPEFSDGEIEIVKGPIMGGCPNNSWTSPRDCSTFNNCPSYQKCGHLI